MPGDGPVLGGHAHRRRAHSLPGGTVRVSSGGSRSWSLLSWSECVRLVSNWKHPVILVT